MNVKSGSVIVGLCVVLGFALPLLYPIEFDTGLLDLTPDRSRIDFDLVFVHGWEGDRITTWRANETEGMLSWLRLAFPTARILTYGYPAPTHQFQLGIEGNLGSRAQIFLNNMLFQQNPVGERPVVFVGHSYGGLVIKKALEIAYTASMVNSKNDFENKKATLFENVRGVVFFATPHLGADHNSLGGLTTWLLSQLIPGFGPVFKELVSLGPDLSILNAKYFAISKNKWESLCFCEQRHWNAFGISMQVVAVPQSYACPGEGLCTCHDVDADHTQIVKPTKSDSPQYRLLLSFIEKLFPPLPNIPDIVLKMKRGWVRFAKMAHSSKFTPDLIPVRKHSDDPYRTFLGTFNARLGEDYSIDIETYRHILFQAANNGVEVWLRIYDHLESKLLDVRAKLDVHALFSTLDMDLVDLSQKGEVAVGPETPFIYGLEDDGPFSSFKLKKTYSVGQKKSGLKLRVVDSTYHYAAIDNMYKFNVKKALVLMNTGCTGGGGECVHISIGARGLDSFDVEKHKSFNPSSEEVQKKSDLSNYDASRALSLALHIGEYSVGDALPIFEGFESN